MENCLKKLSLVVVATPYIAFVEQADQLVILQKRPPRNK